MTSVNFEPIPQISIILCTYNRATYLDKAINSVIQQTFSDWELVIVDDGSLDHTFEVVNKYLCKFNNIRYLKNQNKKQSHAKNAGIQASFGKYITFLDSDDSFENNHLESRIQYMQDHPVIDLIQGGFASEEEIYIADYYQPEKSINLRDCVLGPTFFGKRNVFFELKGFNNIAYGEDTDFWERAKIIFKTNKINGPKTYIYTRAEVSISKSVSEKFYSST